MKEHVVMLIVCLLLLFAVIFGVNACTASDWNDGVCPDCGVRYEMRGVSHELKYYSCDKCGKEVKRY